MAHIKYEYIYVILTYQFIKICVDYKANFYKLQLKGLKVLPYLQN